MKRKNNPKLLPFICLLSISLFLDGCNQQQKEDSSGFIDDSENQDPPFLESAIPLEIECLGETYYVDRENEESFDYMIGYLINENELDFWSSVDETGMIYAIDKCNGVYRNAFDDNLKNRFKLYAESSSLNYEFLAIEIDLNAFMVYSKIGGGNHENP